MQIKNALKLPKKAITRPKPGRPIAVAVQMAVTMMRDITRYTTLRLSVALR